MVKMADQSHQESGKRIVNFYDGNREKGESFTGTFFFKHWVLQKALFTHVLQSFEDRKTTKIRRLDLEQSAPSPHFKLASASSSHWKGVSCRKLGLKLNCMWCFNYQQH